LPNNFPDFGIVSPLATQLSWSHVVEVLALKTLEARLFYLGKRPPASSASAICVG